MKELKSMNNIERSQFLRNHSTGIENKIVFKQFSDTERMEKIETVIKEQDEVFSLEDKLKEITKEYKDKIIEKKARIRIETREVTKGGIDAEENVYLIPNPEDKTMEYYTISGDLISTRNLFQREIIQLGLGGEKKDFKKLASGDN